MSRLRATKLIDEALRRLVSRRHLRRCRVRRCRGEERVEQSRGDVGARRRLAGPESTLRAALLEEHLDALDHPAAGFQRLRHERRVPRNVRRLQANGAQLGEQLRSAGANG